MTSEAIVQKSVFKDDDFIIHSRNLQTSIIEICKITNNVPPPIMGSFLHFVILSKNTNKTVRYGLETMSYSSPFLRANLP